MGNENITSKHETEHEKKVEAGFSLYNTIKRLASLGLITAASLFVVPGNETVSSDEGFDIRKLERIVGKKIVTQVDSGDETKDSILHIGQAHFTPRIQEFAPEFAQSVIDSQKKVEIILNYLSAVDSSCTNVFSEGVTAVSMEELNAIKTINEKIREVSININIYRRIFEILSLEQRVGAQYDVIRAYIAREKISSLPNGFESDIASYLTEEQRDDFDKYKSLVNKFCQQAEGEYKKDAIYFYTGAAFKMYFDGKINLLITEKENKEFDKGTPERDIEREEAVLNNIRPGHIIPLVFGAGHDFTSEVNRYNTQHQDREINLLKIDTQ